MRNKDSEKSLFQNPSEVYRGKPFWAWNGILEKKEVLRQAEIFGEMGFGGFFMHSRTGLETEYLGDEWFQRIGECIEYAESCGMEPWLYDEDRWPSGSAGGMATAEEDTRAHFLQVTRQDKLEWNTIQDNKSVAIFACQMEGNSFQQKRVLKVGDILQEEETALIFTIVEAPERDVYNGNTYLDTMNEVAVKRYMQLTHDKYLSSLSRKDINAVRGVFTDEPHRGPMFTTFNGGREEWVPYTPKLFEKFIGKYGYDLKDYLPDLFFCKTGQLLSKITYQYIELCQELFLESFANPIAEWCHRNDLKLTGHVLHEDSLIAQTIMQGSLMRFYEYMDIPGIDHLLKDNNCFWIVKQVVSVAKQLGKPWVLSEMYGATGWKTTLEEYKNIGDWQALFGVNLRCPHLSWYTMKGEAKRDYPASISFHLAGWKEYHSLEDYFARLHVFLARGEEKPEILVITPIESVWARSYCGAYDVLESRDDIICQIEKQYEDLFWILVRNHIDFDYGDEGIMERHAYVSDGILHIGKCKYTKVLISGMHTMREGTLKLLNEFHEAGGSVVFLGEVPRYIDVVESKRAMYLAEKGICIPFDESAIVKSFKNKCTVPILGEGKEDILACCRQDREEVRYMLLNTNWKEERKDICIVLGKFGIMEQWNPRTGEITTICCEKKLGENFCMTLNFAPGEEKLIRIPYNTQSMNYLKEKNKKKSKKAEFTFPTTYLYQLKEKNICVLDRVSVEFFSEDKTKHHLKNMEVLHADCAFRNIIGKQERSGEMLQPWYQLKYNTQHGSPKRVVTQYSFYVGVKPETLEIALENLQHICQIKLNNSPVELLDRGNWIDPCFSKLELPVEFLKIGYNEIEIEQFLDQQDGFEAVYLLGNFSVILKDGIVPVLEKLPQRLELGDITQQGFPFYSGGITYHMPDEMKVQRKMKVRVKDWKGWTLIAIDGCEKEHFAGFAPYIFYSNGLKEIQLFLTRKNTFGPLHEANPDSPVCEPASFMTKGSEWSEKYVLQKQGLMKEPEIQWMEENHEDERRMKK